MFDFSFGELVVIGAVSLVVIGPERLPKVARTMGAMLARAQRYVANVRADIQREIELDNLKRMQAEMTEAARSLTSEVAADLGDVKQSLDAVASETRQLAATVTAPIPEAETSSGAPATPTPIAPIPLPPVRPERDRR